MSFLFSATTSTPQNVPVSGNCWLRFVDPGWSFSPPLPVSLPYVDGLRVGDAVLSRLVVQQVKEIFDG